MNDEYALTIVLPDGKNIKWGGIQRNPRKTQDLVGKRYGTRNGKI